MTAATLPLALVAHAFGPPESFVLEPRDFGDPGPKQVRIQIHAAGVSFVDVLVAAGKYQLQPPLPLIPGSECAGVIDAVGEGVSPSRIGERVMACGFNFAFAEAAVVPEKLALPIADSMSFVEASVFQVSYATSYHALVQRARLQPGETLLVMGAAGAVGYAAIELGVALGAKVIASASTPEKRALALKAGAVKAIDARSATWREDLKAANDGRPVDVVIDPLGGTATELAFRSLAWNGRLLVIGFAGGGIPKIPTNLALLKGAALLGVDVRQFGIYEPEAAAANIAALFKLSDAGSLHPPIGETYEFQDFATAMNRAAGGESTGRIILKMR